MFHEYILYISYCKHIKINKSITKNFIWTTLKAII